MAQWRIVLPILVVLVLVRTTCTLGKLDCEELLVEDCAFSVSTSGARCVLEKYIGKDGVTHLECQTSIIMAEKQEEWIESDECMKSCGLERMSFGLSTDLLLDTHFTEMLCSSECLNNCPNILDLYINLAAGEGIYLPQLCKTYRLTSRRLIADPVVLVVSSQPENLPLLSSGGALPPMGSSTGGAASGFSINDGSGANEPSPSPSKAPGPQAGWGPNTSPDDYPPTTGPSPSSWTSSWSRRATPVGPTPASTPASSGVPTRRTVSPAASPSMVSSEAVTPSSESTPILSFSGQQLDEEELLYETYNYYD